jgi:hypothetical protein
MSSALHAQQLRYNRSSHNVFKRMAFVSHPSTLQSMNPARGVGSEGTGTSISALTYPPLLLVQCLPVRLVHRPDTLTVSHLPVTHPAIVHRINGVLAVET